MRTHNYDAAFRYEGFEISMVISAKNKYQAKIKAVEHFQNESLVPDMIKPSITVDTVFVIRRYKGGAE